MPSCSELALRAADERVALRDLVAADRELTAVLPAAVLDRCFDDRAWLTHVDEVIARLERLDP